LRTHQLTAMTRSKTLLSTKPSNSTSEVAASRTWHTLSDHCWLFLECLQCHSNDSHAVKRIHDFTTCDLGFVTQIQTHHAVPRLLEVCLEHLPAALALGSVHVVLDAILHAGEFRAVSMLVVTSMPAQDRSQGCAPVVVCISTQTVFSMACVPQGLPHVPPACFDFSLNVFIWLLHICCICASAPRRPGAARAASACPPRPPPLPPRSRCTRSRRPAHHKLHWCPLPGDTLMQGATYSRSGPLLSEDGCMHQRQVRKPTCTKKLSISATARVRSCS